MLILLTFCTKLLRSEEASGAFRLEPSRVVGEPAAGTLAPVGLQATATAMH